MCIAEDKKQRNGELENFKTESLYSSDVINGYKQESDIHTKTVIRLLKYKQCAIVQSAIYR